MQDDIGAVFERPAQIGRREGIIDDERELVLVCDVGDRLDVEDIGFGVTDDLAVAELGLGSDGPSEIFRIIGVDETIGR